MTETPQDAPTGPPALGGALWRRAVAAVGASALGLCCYVGGMSRLLAQTLIWLIRSIVFREVRLGRRAIYGQIVRLGVRSILVVSLVCACVGIILALQMAPPLNEFGQVEQTPNIIAVAVVRELGPLIAAVVITGFAGAAIAAELGAMVVSEEVEALQAHALNPVRFLVVPRVLATIIAMLVLAVIAVFVAIAAGWLIGVTLLGIPSTIYIQNTIDQLKLIDFITGVFKAGVFGLLIGLIACFNGLHVTGGAAGVGRATTHTVVYAIVSIILSDLLFTAMFYAIGWV